MRLTGAAVAALVISSLLAVPASAEVTGYTGLVSDTDGNLISGACFALHTSPTEVAHEFCSDEQGRYLITGVPTDTTYKIRVHADGFRTQWWYDEPDYLNATAFRIPAYYLSERDITLGRGSGTVKGRITDQMGAPTEATVTVQGVDRYYDAIAYTWDLGDGRYEIADLPPGRYQISVYDNLRGTQWVPQQDTAQDAAVFTVTDGAVLVVDEQWLPLGSVEVRVTDALTGRPVAQPCVSVRSAPNERQACGSDGTVRVGDVPPGYWEYTVSGDVSYFPTDQGRHLEVFRSQVTRVDVELEPAAAITTTVIDAETGKPPVESICVHVVAPEWGGQSAHMSQYCSDEKGRLGVGPFTGADAVQLYAFQPRNPYTTPKKFYGAQWVTDNGGSGDQRRALTVTMRDRQTVSIPPIRMDPPGTISGVIRNADTGVPIPGVCTYPYAFNPGQGNAPGRNCSTSEGRYTISDLGPYRWPVEFAPTRLSGYAWQWSGDVADRFSATMAQVTAGGVVETDANLVPGGTVAGTVTDGPVPVDAGYVWTYNARTGDIASPSPVNIDREGRFTLAGHRTQKVYVEYRSLTAGCWYAAAGPAATTVEVTAGSTTTIVADMTGTCARHPGGPEVPPGHRAGGPA